MRSELLNTKPRKRHGVGAFLKTAIGGVVVCLAGAVAVGLLTGAASPPRTSTSGDDVAIRSVVSQAIDIGQTAYLPPQSALGRPLTAAEGGAVKFQMHQRLERTFTGQLLEERQQRYDAIIDGESAGNVRVLAGGEDYIKMTALAINGTTATASTEARVWSRLAQDQGNGRLVPAEPHNTLLYEFQLSLIDGSWLVSAMTFHFAPGSEP